jgi:hypothetical protein
MGELIFQAFYADLAESNEKGKLKRFSVFRGSRFGIHLE